IIMVHVADPDNWFRTMYSDVARFGTKADQYAGLQRMLEEFPGLTWIGAHMGGDPEHPDHLEALLDRYPHFHTATTATNCQAPRGAPGPGLPAPRPFPVRLGPGDAARIAARPLRQPLLVPAHPVGERLGGSQPHRRPRLRRRPRRAGHAAAPRAGTAAGRAGKG